MNTLNPLPIQVSLIDAILRCQPQYWDKKENGLFKGEIDY
jgi:hypothetical protein